MEGKIIQFPEGTNKVIVNTKLVLPELKEQIINFSGRMYYHDSDDCYAIVTNIEWDDDMMEITDKGTEYLKSIVKDYIQGNILKIWVNPENSDNIYCICSLDVITDEYYYEFEARYCRYNEPYRFVRTYTQAELSRIYPNRDKYYKQLAECFELGKVLEQYEKTDNPMVNKMFKALQDKIDFYISEMSEIDIQARDEIWESIPDELFSPW